jgi:hypothetical protein
LKVYLKKYILVSDQREKFYKYKKHKYKYLTKGGIPQYRKASLEGKLSFTLPGVKVKEEMHLDFLDWNPALPKRHSEIGLEGW